MMNEPKTPKGEMAMSAQAEPTPAEKKMALFVRQKELLDTFLAHRTITRAQYEKSLGDLMTKMNIPRDDNGK